MAGKGKVVAINEEDEWRAEDDLRTLISAEKIKGDKKRLAGVMKKKREMKKDLDNVGN